MLNLENNENYAVFDEFYKKKKKTKIKIKFQKMKGIYEFGQHPLVEKFPTATDNIIYTLQ